MMVQVLADGEDAERATPEGDVRTWGMHLVRATTPLRIRGLDVRRALRSRAAAMHRVLADKKSEGNAAWRDHYDRAFRTEAERIIDEAEAKLAEAATPILQRLRDAGGELGLTDAEIRAEFEDAGFGKGDLDTFFEHGYLPYTPPTE